MSSSIEYHTERIVCPECGTKTDIQLISEYDTIDEDYTLDVAGYQECTECKYRFTYKDLENLT